MSWQMQSGNPSNGNLYFRWYACWATQEETAETRTSGRSVQKLISCWSTYVVGTVFTGISLSYKPRDGIGKVILAGNYSFPTGQINGVNGNFARKHSGWARKINVLTETFRMETGIEHFYGMGSFSHSCHFPTVFLRREYYCTEKALVFFFLRTVR